VLDDPVSAFALFEGMVDRLRPRAWMADALCLEYQHVEYFPGRGESDEEAKRICSACLVRAECLRYALELGIRDGVWGGLSPQERAGQQETPLERLRRGTEGGAAELTARTRRRRALAEQRAAKWGSG
jgi:hypothetical protein